MQRRNFLRAIASTLTVASFGACGGSRPAGVPQLGLSPNRRYLVQANGQPFFLLGDTPWFLQKRRIEEVQLILDDRRRKGYNTLLLELLDDSAIPSRDGYGNEAFALETEITRPVEVYWQYADQVLAAATERGFFLILSALWYGAGAGLWMHHVTPEKASLYGTFLGRRFGRFRNLMWMHGGDRNPDPRLAACTRALAQSIEAIAPHHLHTVHHAHEFASAAFHNDDPWLDVNLGYTYGLAYQHILPEYQRQQPVRPVILGETGYENEPNQIELLPDARAGDRWTPYRIRRNAWWAVLSGACGYCAGSRLWRWENDWQETLQVRSIKEAPHLLTLLQALDWWNLVPDTQHRFVTGGYGTWGQADYATAALSRDGRWGLVYLPSLRTVTVDLAGISGAAQAFWFDPTRATRMAATGQPGSGGQVDYQPPGENAAREPDWVLLLQTR